MPARAAIDLAELGQLGNQGAGDDVADAGHAFEEILFGTPQRAGFDQLVDGLVDTRPLGFKPLEHGPERALRNAVVSSGQTLLFGIDHDPKLGERTLGSGSEPKSEPDKLSDGDLQWGCILRAN
jgi:hypothetical protein